MQGRISAVLVHNQEEPFRGLKEALKGKPVKLRRATNCAQANRLLAGVNPPHLVFTEADLPDGTWADVLAIALKAKQPVNVIVVGRVVDTSFYIEVMQNGAFDFIVPPFVAGDLAHVIRCAVDHVVDRREALTTRQGQYRLPPAVLAKSAPIT
jgi:DNA-binding NtrC family response regulator